MYNLPMAIDGYFARRDESWLGCSESWLGVPKLVGVNGTKYVGQQVSERPTNFQNTPTNF